MLHFQQQVVCSDPPEECRNPHTNPSLRTSCPNWAAPFISLVANKECLQGGPQMFSASDGTFDLWCKDAEEVDSPKEDAAARLSDSDGALCRPHHQTEAPREGGTPQHRSAPDAESGLHGDHDRNSKLHFITRHMKPSFLIERTDLQDSAISQVPLRLQIKVSGQRGSLGISIAGGKGSLPYKDQDEGIFISRVTAGGPSEKAGMHVGDRLLEVNGLSMEGATHLEAVSALRNAGSCIKMKVLREGLHLREVGVLDRPHDPQYVQHVQQYSQDDAGQQDKQQKADRGENCLSKRIEAVVCNGNGIADLKRDFNWPQLEAELEKADTLQARKHTMTIPRIILTHPSTSDEDVEFLTCHGSREPPRNFDFAERRVHSDSYDSAFHPP